MPAFALRLFLSVFLMAVLVMNAAPARAHMHHDENKTAPVPAAAVPVGGPFRLTDQDGKTVTDKDYENVYKLVFFGYTSCPDTCPLTLKTLSKALKDLGPAGEAVKVLFITTDPDHDSPKVMKDYIAAFAPAPVVGLTGTPDQIAAAVQKYKVYAQKAQNPDGGYTVDHSSIIYFMSPEGAPLAFFSATDPAAEITEKLKGFLAAPAAKNQ